MSDINNLTNLHATADTFSIELLVSKVLKGQVRVPSFQRGLRWETKDVVDLFDSIYKGYPIGSFLLSKGKKAVANNIKVGALEIFGVDTDNALWVVDGQQRITAISSVLAREYNESPLIDDPWQVYFEPESQSFKPRPQNSSIPIDWVPVSELLNASKLSEWIFNWELGKNSKIRETVFDAGSRIRQYQIPVYIVETENEQYLREIFFRINNFGKSLKWGEIHDAIFGDPEKGLSTLDQLSENLSGLGMGVLDEDQLLICLLAFKGLDVTRNFREHYNRDKEVLKDAAVGGALSIKKAFIFLRDEVKIPHLRLLPRFFPIPVLVSFFTEHPNPNQRTLLLLTRWFWRILLGKPVIDERTLMRKGISEIVKKDEESSVQKLLEFTPKHQTTDFKIPSQFDARSAANRIALVGLNSLEPRDFYDGNLIDLSLNIETYDVSVFRKIVNSDSRLNRSVANRIFSIGQNVARREMIQVLEDQPNVMEILESHAINNSAFKMLQSGDYHGFLETRKITIEEHIKSFGYSMAGWGRSDRPTIEFLLKRGAE